jgi:RimJ/RimL family protein N-acetyltransferase
MLPVFETERLILRPRSMADFADCLAMDRDPEVTRHIAGPWADAAEHEAFLRDRITRAYPEGLGYWSLFPRETPGRFLGWMLLIPQDAIGPEVEIGWRLNRACWGKGYAAEAAVPILRHALRTLALEEIVAEIDAENLRSTHLAAKIGMRRENVTRLGNRTTHRFVMRAADHRSRYPERDMRNPD